VLTRTHRTATRRGLTAGVVVGAAGVMTGVLLFFILTGCGGAGPGAGAGPGQSVQQRSQTVWLRFARCARSHGVPAFPDPNVNTQGQPSFPDPVQAKQEAGQVQAACGTILHQLPAAAANPPPTAAQLRQLKAFARCMRSHGVPGWPDPKPDGTFPLAGTPLGAQGKSGPVRSGIAACGHIYSGGVSAS
jgi:hypothetical protein